MSVEAEVQRGRWAGRPKAAAALRVVAFVIPVATSVCVTAAGSRWLPAANGVVEIVLWWVALTTIAIVTLAVMDRVCRRLLPLAALLKLSLVFPDEAPSRFRVALRTGTVHQLERQVAEVKASGLSTDEVRATEQLLELVGALSVHDRLTRGHSERVRAYSRMIGEQLNLPAEDIERLHWAGLLHDVGKLFVPSEILNKPGKLTDDEFEVIKQHPGWGARLCAPLRDWLGDWVDAVGEHHERWDGRGYPAGLAGEEISLAGRIVAVADVFDVITSARSYKRPTGATTGRQELIRCAGSQFDPRVVRAFLNVSIGRLRLVMGPLSALAQVPSVARLPIVPVATAAASGLATAAALLFGGLLQTPQAATPVAMGEPSAHVRAHDPSPARPDAPTLELAPIGEIAPPTSAPPVDDRTDDTVPPTTVQAAPEREPPLPPSPLEPSSGDGVPPAPPVPPTAVDDAASTLEDTPVAIPVLANDLDAASIRTSRQPIHGLTTIDGATIRYVPDPDFAGTDAFTYDVAGPLGTAAAVVIIDVAPVNDAPTLLPGPDVTTTEDSGPTAISSWASLAPGPSGSGEDAQAVTVTATADNPTLFAIQPAIDASGSLTFTPAPDANGTATFTMWAVDTGGTSNGGQDSTGPVTATIALDPVPDAPVAADDTAAVAEDGSVVVAVLANDTDPDGDPLTITGASGGNGTATTDGTTVTYTPQADSNGTQLVTYDIVDGTGRTSTATVQIVVTPVADAPVATDDAATTLEDTPVAIDVLGNDTDVDGDALTVTAASSSTGTAFTDGTTVTYTPVPDSNGTQLLSYTIDDGTGRTATAIAAVDVTGVNDTPTFTAGADIVIAEDSGPYTQAGWATGITAGPLEGTLQTVSFSAVASDPSLFDIQPILSAAGDLSFSTAPDAWGTTTVAITVSDDGGVLLGGIDTSTVTTLTITITPVNDAPIAGDDAYQTAKNTPLVVAAPGLLANDGDEDGDPLTAAVITGPTAGSVTVSPDGSFTYTPTPGYTGTDSFTYSAGDGATSTTGTVDVQVGAITTPGLWYLAGSGPPSGDWSLDALAPATANPEPDSDGDGSPGLTVKKSNQDINNTHPDESHQWSLVASSPLVLDGPVSLRLWSSSKDFHPNDDEDYSIWLEDCAADGTACVIVANAHDVHVHAWNGGVADWVYREITVGSVSHTLAAGRMMRLRLMFNHHDLWIANSGTRPSQLLIPLA